MENFVNGSDVESDSGFMWRSKLKKKDPDSPPKEETEESKSR
jgi:hypothetical protein